MNASVALSFKSGGLALATRGAEAGQPDGQTVSGYASIFDVPDLVGDVVLPGAFRNSLKERPSVPCLYQHDTHELIGHTLTLAEDQRGLVFTAKLAPGVRRSDDALRLVRAGSLTGVSIGFVTKRSRTVKVDGKSYNGLAEVDLWEISLVTFPAMPQAQVDRNAASDGVLIARMEDKQRRGYRLTGREWRDYLEAKTRELERLANGGRTDRQVQYELLYQIQEAERELARLN